MEHTVDRRTVLGAVSAGSLAALAGCTGGVDDGDGAFRLSAPFFPDSLDPLDQAFTYTNLGLMEGLFRIDKNSEAQPNLVADWDVSDDSLTWTFELRDDVTFHDGSDFNAEAVSFSLDRSFTHSRSRLQGTPVDSVEAVDEMTVEITTPEPLAPLLPILAQPPAGIISPNSVAEDDMITEPIGTGPYAFVSWEPEKEFTLHSYEGYYDGAPEIDSVVYEKAQDGQTRTLKLQNNELNLATNLPNSAADELQGDDAIDLHLVEGYSDRIAIFNTEQPPVDDRRVRQALLYATNDEEIAEFVLNDVGTPAHGPWDSSSVSWSNDDIEPYTYQPDRAEELLAEAGWERDDDDDVRQRDGEPLEIELWAYTEQPNLQPTAEAMQPMLEDVGFDVDVRVTDYGPVEEARQTNDWEVSIEHWPMYGGPSDPDALSKYYTPDNILHIPYENPDLIDLLDEGRRTLDEEQRREIYNEAQEIIMEDVPIGFLTRKANIEAISSSIDGFNPHPNIYDYGIDNLSR